MCDFVLHEWPYATDTRVTLFAILAVIVLIVRADRRDRQSAHYPPARMVVVCAKLMGVSIVAIILTLRFASFVC